MRLRRSYDPFAVPSLATSAGGGGVIIRTSLEVASVPLPGETRQYLGRLVAPVHLRWWFGVMTVGLIILALRAGMLQLAGGDYYRGLAEGNRLRLHELPAQRGLLFDRFGAPLVRNDPRLQLEVIPLDLPPPGARLTALIEEVAGLIGRPPAEVGRQVRAMPRDSYQPVVVAEDLTHDQAIRLTVIASRFPSVRLGQSSVRAYLHGEATSLSHVLGYLGKISPAEAERTRESGYAPNDRMGKSGLELSLEEALRGINGREQVEVDAIGRRQELIAQTSPVSGAAVTLTVDVAAQRALEAALQSAIAAAGAPGGAAVALDPRTGEVLALVSLPTFDNNQFSAGMRPEDFSRMTNDPGLPLFNRAIQGTYPSGSVIKPVVAAAALAEGIITERTTIMSTGGLRFEPWFFPDWKAGGHGPTNLSLALAESVNTYFYHVGGGYRSFAGLGVERLTAAFRRVGLGLPTNIGLAGEAAGLVPSPAWKLQTTGQAWYIGDTYHLAIGQGDLLVTPVQVANYTAMIANGGTWFQPHLVREIRPAGSTVGNRAAPRVVRAGVFSPEHLAAVRRGLRRAVQTGSARALAGLSLAAAGKTGTAQWSTVKPPHAWFTGYAPADNPRVVLTVVVEEGGEGSVSAVPVAARFFQWWAEHRVSSSDS